MDLLKDKEPGVRRKPGGVIHVTTVQPEEVVVFFAC